MCSSDLDPTQWCSAYTGAVMNWSETVRVTHQVTPKHKLRYSFDNTRLNNLYGNYVTSGAKASPEASWNLPLFPTWLGQAKYTAPLTNRLLLEAGYSYQRGDFRVNYQPANALTDTGLFDKAQELLGATLALAADWTDPFLRARLYWSQSRLHGLRQEPVLAVGYAKKALDILELTEHTAYLARAHQLLAFLEIEQGNPEEALGLLRRGRELLGESGGRVEVAKFKLEEARALASMGRAEDAGGLAMEVIPLLGDSDSPDAGRAYLTLASVFEQIGDRPRALELCELAIESLEQHGAPYLSEAYARLGELLKAEGRTEEALELLEKALAARQRSPRPL